MKYTININQKEIMKLSPEMTFDQAAILEVVKVLCNSKSKKMKRKKIDKELCTMISKREVLKDLPMLQCKDIKKIQREMVKLENYGYIKRYAETDPNETRKGMEARLYVCLTHKVELLEWTKKDIKRHGSD